MTIGFDAKRLFFNNTGLGVYSRLLLTGLAAVDASHRYVLFAKRAQDSPHWPAFASFPTVSRSRPGWRTFGMVSDVRREGCDIYHGLSHELPRGIQKRCPTVVTIHDLIFRKDPSLYPLVDRLIYHLKWAHSCRIADRIIAVSTQTKQDLVEIYEVDEDRVQVIPPPVDDRHMGPTGPTDLPDKYALPATFLLYVGSITRRKNLLGLLQALDQSDPGQVAPLVVIGSGGGPYWKEVQSYVTERGMRDRVHLLGSVANEDLPNFYRAAVAMVYPSHYEGFGIPIVESLMCGTPVVTSCTSAMPETAGPGAILVDPASIEEIADALQRVCGDSALQKDLAVAGQAYVQRYRTQTVAQQVLELYHEVLR